MRKFPQILFFIASTMATDKENDEAFEMGPNVAFRNASLVATEGALEECDGVAGLVPARYEAKYPTAHEAIQKWQTAEMERRRAHAAGLPDPADVAEAAKTSAPKAGTTPPGDDKAHGKGQAAAKAPTPAPAAAAGWKANA